MTQSDGRQPACRFKSSVLTLQCDKQGRLSTRLSEKIQSDLQRAGRSMPRAGQCHWGVRVRMRDTHGC